MTRHKLIGYLSRFLLACMLLASLNLVAGSANAAQPNYEPNYVTNVATGTDAAIMSTGKAARKSTTVAGGWALPPTMARNQYGIAGSKVKEVGGLQLPALLLPKPGTLYLVPLNVVNWEELPAMASLQTDGEIMIGQPGLYKISCHPDWPGQHMTDVNLRHYGVGWRPAGSGLVTGTSLPYSMQKVQFTWLTSSDVPASSVPQYVRGTANWPDVGGITIPPWTSVSPVDIQMPTTIQNTTAGSTSAPVIVDKGDVVEVSDTALAGAGSSVIDAIVLRGVVIGPNLVHVTMTNMSSQPVTVPAGVLKVVAGTATTTTGESADGWSTNQTMSEALDVGDLVSCIGVSFTPGDYWQEAGDFIMQIERVGVLPAAAKPATRTLVQH